MLTWGTEAQNPSALMRRQLRRPPPFLQMNAYGMCRPGQPPEEAHFVVQSGSNTAVVARGKEGMVVLAHMDQLQRRSTEPSTDQAPLTAITEVLLQQHHQ